MPDRAAPAPATGVPVTPLAPGPLDRVGLLVGSGAYVLWGAMPLFFPLLRPAGPVEIIAHRVVWSLLFCLLLVAVTRSGGAVRTLLRDRRAVGVLAVAAVLLAVNWLVFVLGVLTGHTVDAALGYFINPLVTVGLAVLVLHERLRRVQWAALGLGAGAVVVIAAGLGTVPWVALTLAASFGLYGLLKSRLGATVGAVPGLTVETAVLLPLALGYLAVAHARGTDTFGAHGTGHVVALVSVGVVTALPLLLFNTATRRLPLSVIGLLQYITPTLQFLVGVLVQHEQMPPARWWGFGLVWVALVVLAVDGVRHSRTRTAGTTRTPGPVSAAAGPPPAP